MKVQLNHLFMAVVTGVVTFLTLSGGLVLALVSGNFLFETFTGHISGFVSGLAALPFVLLSIFGAGALWGLSISWLTGVKARRLVLRTALTYGGVIILAGILLEAVFGLVGALNSVLHLPIHVAFTLAFVPAAGLIAALCTRKLLAALGYLGSRRKYGLIIGAAAGLGFLVINLSMLAMGWQVGGPGAAERYTMLTVMLTSSGGAALVGGGMLGWLLADLKNEGLKEAQING